MMQEPIIHRGEHLQLGASPLHLEAASEPLHLPKRMTIEGGVQDTVLQS
jgi:hypothetical protein